MNFIVGIAGSSLIAWLAYRLRSLSLSGCAAAVVIGTIMYAMGGPAWYGTLLAFFVSSSLLSQWNKKRKAAAEQGYEKGGRRDAGQVMANGGIGAMICVLHYIYPNPLWFGAFIGVMATVNADTWATEIGSLSKGEPWFLLTGRKVPSGTSGGVSILGFGAAAAGGLFIGAVCSVLLPSNSYWFSFAAIGLLSGFGGALVDSLLGARWQLIYRCGVCGREIEASSHCGSPSSKARGLYYMNNDLVNCISSSIGALFGVLLYGGVSY